MHGFSWNPKVQHSVEEQGIDPCAHMCNMLQCYGDVSWTVVHITLDSTHNWTLLIRCSFGQYKFQYQVMVSKRDIYTQVYVYICLHMYKAFEVACGFGQKLVGEWIWQLWTSLRRLSQLVLFFELSIVIISHTDPTDHFYQYLISMFCITRESQGGCKTKFNVNSQNLHVGPDKNDHTMMGTSLKNGDGQNWSRRASIPGLLACKASTLPSELQPLNWCLPI